MSLGVNEHQSGIGDIGTVRPASLVADAERRDHAQLFVGHESQGREPALQLAGGFLVGRGDSPDRRGEFPGAVAELAQLLEADGSPPAAEEDQERRAFQAL